MMNSVITLKDFLSNCEKEELLKRLLLIDNSLKELHQHGFFVVTNIGNIKVVNNQINLASFDNKIDYLNSGFNANGDKIDILELCAIGVCAYNDFDELYSNKDFIAYLEDNLDKFKPNIPEYIYKYYQDIFINKNIDYMSNYFLESSNSKSTSRKYTKSTAIGKAFSDENNAAFVGIIVVPGLLTFIYIIFVIIYKLYLI